MLRKLCLVVSVIALVLSGVMIASAKVTLTYSLWDDNERPAMEASIKEFMKQNPDIDVNIELNGWADYWTKITTGVAAGTVPDVFWGHLAFFSGLVTKGALMDLTPLIKKDNVDLSQYYPQLVQNWSYEGKQYGVPKDWDTIAVFYNKDIFDKAGVPYPTDKMSWNPKDGGDFVKILQKLTIDANGKHPSQQGFNKDKIVQFGMIGIAGGRDQEGWMNFVWMNGGTGVLDKSYGHKFVLDEPKAVETLQFWSDLANKYYVAPGPSSSVEGANNPWEMFKAGKVGLIVAGSWMLADARANLKFKWDIALLPKGPAGRVSCFNGLAHVIYSKTKYPNEAWKLAKWMDSYESQKIVSSYGTVFPAIPKLMPVYLSSTKEKGPVHVKYFIDETAKTGLWPMHVNWSQISDIIYRELDVVFSGSETAQEGLNKIKTQVEPLLK